MQNNHMYIAIDLKTFYASVECVERNLDPLDTNLVVADPQRTEKTICLAVSPSLKAFGISGRARLFEVVQKVKEVNALRKSRLRNRQFTGSSYSSEELKNNESYELSYIIAPPRMSLYMKYSTQIYNIYLKYVAPEDIHIYSVDEVFIDVGAYLNTYKMTPHQLAMTMIKDVLESTGITATAGIGTNLYLCKIAMDIVAKHIPADKDGVRIAELDERSYREKLWGHKPITDFWRVGTGYASRLKEYGMYTMGDVARCSLGGEQDFYNEELLYKLFGVNAELLIDHAWGWEPCTIAQVKAYKPESNSIGSGQVLHCPYDFQQTRLIIKEMTDLLALDLVDKHLVTDQLVLTVGYDIGNLESGNKKKQYQGEITVDRYGRKVPKHAHGTANLKNRTSSSIEMIEMILELYDKIVNPDLFVRRVYITANHVVDESLAEEKASFEQLDLFTDYSHLEEEQQKRKEKLEREKKLQHAALDIKKKFGKNALLKGMNLEEGATAVERNRQIGGHKA